MRAYYARPKKAFNDLNALRSRELFSMLELRHDYIGLNLYHVHKAYERIGEVKSLLQRSTNVAHLTINKIQG
ncbi:MAG: hypothetical protein H6695_04830 [Deferribacteres bacterium]|nr:hypothetical protein [Deferribacteres bacterium]